MKRCTKCGAAGRLDRGLCHKDYEAHRTRLVAYGQWKSQLVPAEPIRRHVEDLHDAGLSYRQIADLAGTSERVLQDLRIGGRGNPPSKNVLRKTADRVLSVPIPADLAAVSSPSDLIPVIGVRRRLQALIAAGWTQMELAARLGITFQNFGTMLHQRDWVTTRRHREVVALWTDLQLQPGPSDRARRYGREKGWPLPMQWAEDGLDDPDAIPDLADDQRRVGTAERKAAAAAEYQHARDVLGMANDQAVVYVARGVGVALKTLRVWGFDTARAEKAAQTPEQAERRRIARNEAAARKRREAAA